MDLDASLTWTEGIAPVAISSIHLASSRTRVVRAADYAVFDLWAFPVLRTRYYVLAWAIVSF